MRQKAKPMPDSATRATYYRIMHPSSKAKGRVPVTASCDPADCGAWAFITLENQSHIMKAKIGKIFNVFSNVIKVNVNFGETHFRDPHFDARIF